jgi:hypothetical protein
LLLSAAAGQPMCANHAQNTPENHAAGCASWQPCCSPGARLQHTTPTPQQVRIMGTYSKAAGNNHPPACYASHTLNAHSCAPMSSCQGLACTSWAGAGSQGKGRTEGAAPP